MKVSDLHKCAAVGPGKFHHGTKTPEKMVKIEHSCSAAYRRPAVFVWPQPD